MSWVWERLECCNSVRFVFPEVHQRLGFALLFEAQLKAKCDENSRPLFCCLTIDSQFEILADCRWNVVLSDAQISSHVLSGDFFQLQNFSTDSFLVGFFSTLAVLNSNLGSVFR